MHQNLEVYVISNLLESIGNCMMELCIFKIVDCVSMKFVWLFSIQWLRTHQRGQADKSLCRVSAYSFEHVNACL